LHVHTGWKYQAARRHNPDFVALAAFEQTLPIWRLALVDPGFSERCVHPDLQKLLVILGIQEALGRLTPGKPTHRRVQTG
jgi:hypothetical protein